MIQKKWVDIAYVLTLGSAVFFVLAMWTSRWFLVPAIVMLAGYFYTALKKICCPHCGGVEKLSNLRRASKQEYHCSHCEKVIEVR